MLTQTLALHLIETFSDPSQTVSSLGMFVIILTLELNVATQLYQEQFKKEVPSDIPGINLEDTIKKTVMLTDIWRRQMCRD